MLFGDFQKQQDRNENVSYEERRGRLPRKQVILQQHTCLAFHGQITVTSKDHGGGGCSRGQRSGGGLICTI